LLLDLVRLSDEVLDDDEDQERQDERLDDLEETPERWSLTHKSGSIGGRAGRPAVAARRPRPGPAYPPLPREFDPPKSRLLHSPPA
jgi:hypothetical protein